MTRPRSHFVGLVQPGKQHTLSGLWWCTESQARSRSENEYLLLVMQEVTTGSKVTNDLGWCPSTAGMAVRVSLVKCPSYDIKIGCLGACFSGIDVH